MIIESLQNSIMFCIAHANLQNVYDFDNNFLKKGRPYPLFYLQFWKPTSCSLLMNAKSWWLDLLPVNVLNKTLQSYYDLHQLLHHSMIKTSCKLIDKLEKKTYTCFAPYFCTYILFLHGTFFTVVCIWYSWPTTYYTAALIRTIITFITDPH